MMCDEEIFEINDFSTSSDWERFIADLEEILHQWILNAGAGGSNCAEETNKESSGGGSSKQAGSSQRNNIPKVSKLLADPNLWHHKHDQIKFGRVQFSLQYHFFRQENKSSPAAAAIPAAPAVDQTAPETCLCQAWRDMNSLENDWPASGHPLIRYYGLSQFLLLQPLNGETIDSEDRARHLIGSAAIALHNLDCELPFFCQIGDPSRRLFMGIGLISNGFRTHYEMIQFPEVPPSYRYFDELMMLFKKKLYSSFSYSPVDAKPDDPDSDSGDPLLAKVRVSVRFTYLLSKWPTQYLLFGPPGATDSFLAEHFEYFRVSATNMLSKPFVFRDDLFGDPLRQMQLATTWPSIAEELITDNAHHSVLQPSNAPRWSLRALFYLPAECRKFCRTAELLDLFARIGSSDRPSNKPILAHLPTTPGDSGSSTTAGDQRDVRSALSRLTKPTVVTPTASSLTSTTAQLLSSITKMIATTNPGSMENIDVLVQSVFERRPTQSTGDDAPDDHWTQLKSAPIDSLTWRIGNLAANLYCQTRHLGTLAQVWKCFVDQLRKYWRDGQTLPHMMIIDDGQIDHGHCLLHQKLQMLDCCIRQKIKREQQPPPSSPGSHKQQPDPADDDDEFFDAEESFDTEAEGQLEVLRDSQNKTVYMLTDPDVAIYVPVTQDSSPVTEDALAAQMQSLSVLDDAKAKIRLQSAGLLSDMEAFKAANPGATFEDFIRWHSPRDWIESADDDSGRMRFELSRRMRESSTWTELWAMANPCPVRRQKRLFNYSKEAEELLQWLETIGTGQLVQLLIPVVAKSVLEQIFRHRNEILDFVRQSSGIEPDAATFLPMDLPLLRFHFNQTDYGKLVEELRFLELDMVRFYSVLRKLTQAYTAGFGRDLSQLFDPGMNAKPSGAGLGGPRKMLLKEQMKLTGRALIQFLLDLLHEPEVEFGNTDPLAELVVRMFADGERFQYEQTTSVGDRIRTGDQDDHDGGWPRSSSGGILSVPTGKEFIIRAVAVPRPAPYSRPASHRMYCLLSSDFRLATATTEDTAYC